MMSKQLMESLLTAGKSLNNIVHLNNTAANGDDKYLAPYETLVIIDNDASYTQNVYLPPVGESRGVIITMLCPDVGGGVNIYDRDDSSQDWSDTAFDADDEYAVFFCDGKGWKTLATDIS